MSKTDVENARGKNNNQSAEFFETALNFIKRACLALEEGDFKEAEKFADKALDIDAECGEAYLVQLLCAYRKKTVEDLAYGEDYRGHVAYKRLMRFADDKLCAQMREVENNLLAEMEKKRLKKIEEEKKKALKKIADIERLKPIREKLKVAQNLIAAGVCHTVGLKKDGAVVGYNNCGQCNVSGWRDIVAVAANYDHTFGLKKDGTVVAVGDNEKGQCNVSGWKLF
jgi:tetratricopeptide (TPR) repeat protein